MKCWFTIDYREKRYGWTSRCKYLQPRMQTFATPLANVCVRKLMRSSAARMTFFWPRPRMHGGTRTGSSGHKWGMGRGLKSLFLGDWECRKVFFLNDFSAQNVSFVHFCSPDWTWKWLMSNCHFDRIKSAMPCLLSLLRIIPGRRSPRGRDRDNHRH